MVLPAMPRQSGAGAGRHFPHHAHFWVTSAPGQRDRRFLPASGCQCAGPPEHLAFSAHVPQGAAPWLPKASAPGRSSASPPLSQWPNITSSQLFCPTWPKIPCKKTRSTSPIAVHISPHTRAVEREGRDVLNTNTDAAASRWGFRGLSLYLKV